MRYQQREGTNQKKTARRSIEANLMLFQAAPLVQITKDSK